MRDGYAVPGARLQDVNGEEVERREDRCGLTEGEQPLAERRLRGGVDVRADAVPRELGAEAAFAEPRPGMAFGRGDEAERRELAEGEEVFGGPCADGLLVAGDEGDVVPAAVEERRREVEDRERHPLRREGAFRVLRRHADVAVRLGLRVLQERHEVLPVADDADVPRMPLVDELEDSGEVPPARRAAQVRRDDDAEAFLSHWPQLYHIWTK